MWSEQRKSTSDIMPTNDIIPTNEESVVTTNLIEPSTSTHNHHHSNV